MNLYLASTSPRRKDLLFTLGIPFKVIKPLFDEKPTSLSASEEALFFAEQKALSVQSKCPNALILSADTIVESNGEKIGKPRDEKEAASFLKKLSGETHFVHTGIVLLNASTHAIQKHLESVSVSFRKLSSQEIQGYVSTQEPMGKAGAYAIQGKARAFITQVEGEEESAIGLPLRILKGWLRKAHL